MSKGEFGRIDRDAWFTPRETSQKIVDYLLEKNPEWREMEWVEPSAGNGSFIDAAQNRGIKINGYDLIPQREDIIQADFLNFNKDLLSERLDLTGKIVIGNPPYGRYNKLTMEFIEQSFNLGAEKVAFLLLGSILNVSYLKKINRKIDQVKIIETKFEDAEGKNLDVDMELSLIVFSKEKENKNWELLKELPYCRGIRHGEKICGEYIIMGFKYIDKVKNFKEKLKEYKKTDQNFYTINEKRKVYSIYSFYNKNILKEDKEFLKNIQKYIRGITGKPTPQTLNYWLLPENRVKIDWEPL